MPIGKRPLIAIVRFIVFYDMSTVPTVGLTSCGEHAVAWIVNWLNVEQLFSAANAHYR